MGFFSFLIPSSPSPRTPQPQSQLFTPAPTFTPVRNFTPAPSTINFTPAPVADVQRSSGGFTSAGGVSNNLTSPTGGGVGRSPPPTKGGTSSPKANGKSGSFITSPPNVGLPFTEGAAPLFSIDRAKAFGYGILDTLGFTQGSRETAFGGRFGDILNTIAPRGAGELALAAAAGTGLKFAAPTIGRGAGAFFKGVGGITAPKIGIGTGLAVGGGLGAFNLLSNIGKGGGSNGGGDFFSGLPDLSFGGVGDAVGDVFGGVGDAFNGLFAGGGDFFKSLSGAAGTGFQVIDTGANLLGGLSGVLNSVGGLAREFSGVSDLLTDEKGGISPLLIIGGLGLGAIFLIKN
tara:strand:+ start:1150 stop:2184 length:1035 start_codon:yes stop_codon:yes gene_type:complete